MGDADLALILAAAILGLVAAYVLDNRKRDRMNRALDASIVAMVAVTVVALVGGTIGYLVWLFVTPNEADEPKIVASVIEFTDYRFARTTAGVEILEDGTLRVGVREYPPSEWVDVRTGNLGEDF